jgi:hypothetical protein
MIEQFGEVCEMSRHLPLLFFAPIFFTKDFLLQFGGCRLVGTNRILL